LYFFHLIDLMLHDLLLFTYLLSSLNTYFSWDTYFLSRNVCSPL
jgi:hypothetical protein